jgi:predicted site-specific integrase-resolvase
MTAAKHLTPHDLAERLQLPADTIKKWRVTGEGPLFIRVGKYVRYREVDVERWEQSRLASTP